MNETFRQSKQNHHHNIGSSSSESGLLKQKQSRMLKEVTQINIRA